MRKRDGVFSANELVRVEPMPLGDLLTELLGYALRDGEPHWDIEAALEGILETLAARRGATRVN